MRAVWIAMLILVLATGSQAIQAIELSPEHFVKNQDGYCTWASLDTLGHHLDLYTIKGLLPRRKAWSHVVNDPGVTSAVQAQLDICRVDYILHADGVYDKVSLAKYADSHGCVVTLLKGSGYGCHSILVTKYAYGPQGDQVEFYDSNSKQLRHGSKAWFDTYWSGNLIVLLGMKETPAVQAPAQKEALP